MLAPEAAAAKLEAALFRWYAEPQLPRPDAAGPRVVDSSDSPRAVAKAYWRYKRRLHVLWGWLAPESSACIPTLRDLVLHGAVDMGNWEARLQASSVWKHLFLHRLQVLIRFTMPSAGGLP